jgi:hypothetical protein
MRQYRYQSLVRTLFTRFLRECILKHYLGVAIGCTALAGNSIPKLDKQGRLRRGDTRSMDGFHYNVHKLTSRWLYISSFVVCALRLTFPSADFLGRSLPWVRQRAQKRWYSTVTRPLMRGSSGWAGKSSRFVLTSGHSCAVHGDILRAPFLSTPDCRRSSCPCFLRLLR